jgi:hypothetical protein
MSRGGYRQINKSFNACAFDEYLNSQHALLPTLADVEQISPRVIRVLGQNPGKVIVMVLPNLYDDGLIARISSLSKEQTPGSWEPENED